MAKRLVRAKAQDPQRRHPLPRAAGAPAARAHRRRARRRSTCCSTRGTPPAPARPLLRRDLAAEAIRLARLLVALLPDEPEAHGLLALMLLQDARRAARVDADGDAGDRSRSRTGRCWDRGADRRGRARAATRPAARPRRAPTSCRRRSPRCHATRRPPRTPTGRRSPRSTSSSRGSRRRRWSSSTARSRSPWPRARRPGWRWSTRSADRALAGYHLLAGDPGRPAAPARSGERGGAGATARRSRWSPRTPSDVISAPAAGRDAAGRRLILAGVSIGGVAVRRAAERTGRGCRPRCRRSR